MTGGDIGASGDWTAQEAAAMRAALRAAATPGVPSGPNPRVGATIITEDGELITGYHRGAGTPHAEVDALSIAGERARGGIAVVTLEPCNHTGRTGPCAQALIAAGVRRVVFAQADGSATAAGGARALRAAGIDVAGGLMAEQAESLNEIWRRSVALGRPFVTWKVGATLDGRIAASDGTSRWITSDEARADVHVLRSEVDAIAVGTGTALLDDPALTVRGVPSNAAPLRVVIGRRDIPQGARLRDGSAPTLHLRTQEPAEAVAALAARGIHHVLLEGGPTLAAGFLRAGLIDRIRWYSAPALLGSGASAIGDLGVASIAGAQRFRLLEVSQVGPDIRMVLDPRQYVQQS